LTSKLISSKKRISCNVKVKTSGVNSVKSFLELQNNHFFSCFPRLFSKSWLEKMRQTGFQNRANFFFLEAGKGTKSLLSVTKHQHWLSKGLFRIYSWAGKLFQKLRKLSSCFPRTEKSFPRTSLLFPRTFSKWIQLLINLFEVQKR